MTTSTLEERKQNIDEIKASFPDPAHSERYRDFSTTEEDIRPAFGFPKIRFLLALMLFGFFVYCDKSGFTVKEYTTEAVYQWIEEPFPLEKVMQKVEDIFAKSAG